MIKKILLLLMIGAYLSASKLRITNLSDYPITFNYQSAGKIDSSPINIGSHQSKKIHPGLHGIDMVSWAARPEKKAAEKKIDDHNNDQENSKPIDLTTYIVPLEVSPIRVHQRLIIYNGGKYYYTIDKKYMQATAS